MAMPDAHSGYGFSHGGVAAFDRDTGIISPGGVDMISIAGSDNQENLTVDEVRPDEELIRLLFQKSIRGRLKK